MTARESYDFSGVPYTSSADETLTDQQQTALEDLELILEHTVVARPTRYKVVTNGQMLHMANFMLAEVHRTKEISRKVRMLSLIFSHY